MKPEDAVDAALRDFGQALAQLDPFRFRAWAELGLTTAQLRVMFLMRENPGVTAGALAARLSVTPPTISGIVDRLVKLGLVRREDDAADRRLVRNFLSGRGEDTCGCLERGAGLFTRRILVEMDEADLDAFTRGLRAFINAAEHVSRVEPNLAVVAMPGGSGS
ncbi:MAG: MarR family transcriptional regulator [Chloroflexi bacterium]|nr:MarR family transcriptional regulator [Chloroflexota bacterium]